MQTLIYGAYGFTGRLIAREAVRRGLRPMLAGRNAEKLERFAKELKLPCLQVDLDDRSRLVNALIDVDVVVHCAGPFVGTVSRMVAACLHTGTNYLDITGEVAVIDALASLSDRASDCGVMLLPGIGMDVAPTDVVAVKLHELMPDAVRLDLAVKSTGTISRGTLRTMLGQIDEGSVIREEGELKSVRIGSRLRKMCFGHESEYVACVPLGDCITAYRSTGIENITTYMRFPSGSVAGVKFGSLFFRLASIPSLRRILIDQINRIPEGPSETIAEKARVFVSGEVQNSAGEKETALLTGPEAYRFTACIVVEALRRMEGGIVSGGFQTPAGLFGSDFLDSIPGVEWLQSRGV